jgi:hypothetical protein
MEWKQVGGIDACDESPWVEYRRGCWENSLHNPDLQNKHTGLFEENTLRHTAHCGRITSVVSLRMI